MATSLQRLFVLADSPYIDSCLNLFTTGHFFLSQIKEWPMRRGPTAVTENDLVVSRYGAYVKD